MRDSRIYEAWSDEPWVNDGAAVRVSLVAFGRPSECAQLNGIAVDEIAADLTPLQGNDAAELTSAARLATNVGASFIGTQKNGPFEIPGSKAREWLKLPNPNGHTSAEVLRLWANGLTVTRRPEDLWVIDFDKRSLEESSLYEQPFEHVTQFVKPTRLNLRRDWHRNNWWCHGDPRPALKRALENVPRQIITPRVSKHRVFAWFANTVLPDSAVVAIARADDTTFGILHSRVHELWSLRMCTWLGVGNDPRYTPTTCFETFPFPAGLTPHDTAHQRTQALEGGALIPADLPPPTRAHAQAIAQAAHRLDALRQNWLNPPEWTRRRPEVVPLGMEQSPYPDRIEPKPGLSEADAKALQKRTLTNLYNQRPAWLAQAHAQLDAFVAAAYGWQDYTADMADDEILRRLLQLNHERAL